MTPDEVVRKIQTLEGAARFLGSEQEKLKASAALSWGRLGLLEKKMDRLLTQQGQLLAAIRGMEAPVAPVA